MKLHRKVLLAVCPALLFPMAAMAAETQLVTATGYGMNVEEAKKAAVRAAVESVVGTLVDAETLVENDELVQDKILSYSAGLVEDVKIIGEPSQTSSGLVTVRAQVKVRKTELAERVKSTIKTSVRINGESLYQQVVFNQQNLNDADKIMQSLFSSERVQGLLKFEPDMDNGSPIAVDMTTGEVTVSIKGGIDMESYKQWADEIIAKLEPMATQKAIGTASFQPLRDIPYYWPKKLVEGVPFYCVNESGFPYKFDEIRHKYGIQEGLGVLRSFRSGEVVIFAFDKDKQALLDKGLAPFSADYHPAIGVISVSLLDKTGETISRAKIELEHALIRYDDILPAYESPLSKYYWCPWGRERVSFGRLTPQDLRDIDSISVEVELNLKSVD